MNDIKLKIIKYDGEIEKTENDNLKKFRYEEICDLKVAVNSFRLFFAKGIDEGIQCLYKQNKGQLLKLQEYRKNLEIILAAS